MSITPAQRRYRETHRAEVNQWTRNWRGRNSTRLNAQKRAARSRRHVEFAWIVKAQAFEYLGGSRCVDCGYDKHLDGLEFDHIPERGPKLYSIGTLTNLGYWAPVLQRELDKCEVVCGTCHSIRTQARKG